MNNLINREIKKKVTEPDINIEEKEKKIELNALYNPGNFCYILSSIHGLRDIFIDFFNYHKIIISYYEKINELCNIFKSTSEFLLDFDYLILKSSDKIINSINEINKKYNIPRINSIDDIKLIIDKLKKEHVKIICSLLLKKIVLNIINNDKEVKELKIINTINFIKLFSICANNNGLDYICNGEQNDSNEFIIILLDYLNDVVSMPKKCLLDNIDSINIPLPLLNKKSTSERVKIQLKKYYNNKYSKDYSYFDDKLNMLILNIIKCINCNFKQTSINSCNNLCCSIPNIDNINIHDCLNEYFKEELIEYKCDNCGETNENIMYKKILEEKKYLIITLKKFDYNIKFNIITKKHSCVNYPLILNINNYHIKNINDKYYLKGIINHEGMLNYGHYYAIVSYNNNWYMCNDEKVEQLNYTDIINNKNSYILIYKKY